MEQIILVRIIAATVYFWILGIFVVSLIKCLKDGKTVDWMQVKPTAKQREKWKKNLQNNNIIFTKKDNPKEYWRGIALRIFMIVVEVVVGFIVYNKLF